MFTHWPFWQGLAFLHGLQPCVTGAAVIAHGVTADAAVVAGAADDGGRIISHLLPAVFGAHLQKKCPFPSENPTPLLAHF